MDTHMGEKSLKYMQTDATGTVDWV